MKNRTLQSWGRYPRSSPRGIIEARFRDSALPKVQPHLLPFGNGRSYGDSCLNNGGYLLRTRGLNRFMAFDPRDGRLCCESGVLLSEILALVANAGWFLPVTPGTQFVTVGGAIANDVHGKNHHRAGSFGHHVTRFELLRSDGQRLLCSREENTEWFTATIGGLGLTGLIVWAELQLRRIMNPWMRVETTRFDGLDGFFDVAERSDRAHEYTVAWIDCSSRGKKLGRGLFMAGDHAPALSEEQPAAPKSRLRVPIDPPLSLIGHWSLKAFNAVYYRKQWRRIQWSVQHYRPFFYPLDSVLEWNRIYGPRGFLQYQCVVPSTASRDACHALLAKIADSGQGSFLSVLKIFGDRGGAGLLSFPRPGVTLALDFPNHGERTLRLLSVLDDIVREAGGAIYSAKDARMSPEIFVAGYPAVSDFQRFVDPVLSSTFWRRMNGISA